MCFIIIVRQKLSAVPIFIFFSIIVRVCFKAVIQSSKMPEIALF